MKTAEVEALAERTSDVVVKTGEIEALVEGTSDVVEETVCVASLLEVNIGLFVVTGPGCGILAGLMIKGLTMFTAGGFVESEVES